METSASALPPMSRICNSFMKGLMIKHDSQLLTCKAGSDSSSTNDLPSQNGDTESKIPVIDEEAMFNSLLKLDCQWLLGNLN